MSATPPRLAPPRMGYAGSALLRAAEERDEGTLARALGDPSARLYLNAGGRWLARGPKGAVPDPLFSPAEAQGLGARLEEAVLLGWTPGAKAPRLALALPGPEAPAGGLDLLDLRAAALAGLLDPQAEGDLAQAQALLNWQARTLFCGVCGAPTRPALAGYRRDCTGCGAPHFPRTDPVVIMLVHDGAGACLFGRQPQFPPGMWSCLAGFVEPGETIEDAVRREVLEEVGLAVGEVRYEMSQPWPFPGSLMIGCTARAQGGSIAVQESELEAARWFGREEVVAMLEERHEGGLTTPRPFAIAHHLARRFAGL